MSIRMKQGWANVALAWVLVSGCGGNNGEGDTGHELDLSGLFDTGPGDIEDDVPLVACNGSQDCPAELPVCDLGTRTCVQCKTDGHCGGDTPYCHPSRSQCVQCILNEQCPTGVQYCLEGTCSQMVCIPDSATCVGNEVHVCSADGMNPTAQIMSCGTKICQLGNCLECKPNEVSCKENQVITCNASGSSYEVTLTCAEGQSCFGGQCMVCHPGQKKCEGSVPWACNMQGTGWEPLQDCAASGLKCMMGTCISPCATDIKQNTNAGCEFWAVDLDNAYVSDVNGTYDAAGAQYAVIASNTSKDATATVTVTLPNGTPQTAQVAPNSLHKFELAATWGVNNTEKANKGFKITSTQPITVYQFNPLSNEGVFSNDASVLMPVPSLGTEYYAMSYPQRGGVTFRGFVTVVGTTPTPTQVTIQPAARTLAGTGINSYSKGQTFTVTLNQGEVFNLECDDPTGDLTGTRVSATAPVVVFSGHEASNTADACCADHMEQQMAPVDAWGKTYYVTRSFQRWMEKDHVRIVAAYPDTVVTVKPPVGTIPVLQPGESFSFTTNQNLEVTATQPIMVAQFLASSYEILNAPDMDFCMDNSDCPPNYTCDDWEYACVPPSCSSPSNCPSGHTCEDYGLGSKYCEPIGDPSLILMVPAEQFLDSYVFLTPDAYVKDYVNIIAPSTAAQVLLDGTAIPKAQFQPIGQSGFAVYSTLVADGVHTLSSDAKVGVIVYGYDNDVSYGYPGGMALEKKTQQ